MNKQTTNLIVFLGALVAGVSCIALGHPEIGGAILVGAVGHALPSPFQTPKAPE